LAASKTVKTRRRSLRVEDVARVAGVSPITVSRALSTPGRVAEATRLRVIQAVAETGYVVNPLASGLKSGRSHMIMAITGPLDRPSAAGLDEIALTLAETSLHLMLCRLPPDGLNRTLRLGAMLGLRPRLVIGLGDGLSAGEIDLIRAAGIPLSVPEAVPAAGALAALLRETLPAGTFAA
jgi:LacI family gluconate utilization system Gnt-I transcriptional repressor